LWRCFGLKAGDPVHRSGCGEPGGSLRLSIVMPVLNEAAGIHAALLSLGPLRAQGHEVIVVDGGSSDGTADMAVPLADRVLPSATGRALQMNAGAALAQGDVLLFLHADTQLPVHADTCIQVAIEDGAVWGRFDVQIQGRSRALWLVAALMNLRSRWTGICTGDQALFVRADTFKTLRGYSEQPLMEDIDLCRRLRAVAAPACLRDRVRTSGRRWDQAGPWRTITLMWWLRWRYWRGTSAEDLARLYR
jgi:rSAM/selenodomain-associated transferase 2